jgi:hypothetical protein
MKRNRVVLLSNGDFRDTVGLNCWPKQVQTLELVKQHGFITTQSEGCRVFSGLDPEVSVVLVLSSWAWAHHVASSARLHRGPVLLLANFDGTWPGLVSLLNHSATFERLGVQHSKVWSDTFSTDPRFMSNLKTWIEGGAVSYSDDHVTPRHELKLADQDKRTGEKIARDVLTNKRIMGQMDPGCMGMLNAVVSPDRLAAIGMPLELLSQSDLVAEMGLVSTSHARAALDWLRKREVRFHWGSNDATELTEAQVLEQMKMYVAAGRIYHRYGLSAIGIPYQYGLVRVTSASDLAEGMLNNSDRPSIVDPESGQTINRDKVIVHFNEGDVGSGVPQVLMHDILMEKGLPPETTLHDIRWGDTWEGKFVWAFQISGGAPPAHFGGWARTSVHRQTPMYFPKGGGTCSGISKPGTITWARFYESFDQIGMDIGTGEVLALPEQEVRRRLSCTSEEWPLANVHIPGYERDQMMSSHKSNHITICYGNIARDLAAAASSIGVPVRIVGAARADFR